MNEKFINTKYNKFLQIITRNWHDDETYSTDLNKLGKALLGNKFRGVYAYDRIPSLKSGDSCIFNLDKSSEPGSHWCAMYLKNKQKYVYDSFGRRVMKKQKNIIYSESDAEQKDKEANCGQRCISWLICVYTYGIKNSLKI